MDDNFTVSFIDNPDAFPALHQQLEKRGLRLTLNHPALVGLPTTA
ncbi:hypothetical protein [Duganella sp. P38]